MEISIENTNSVVVVVVATFKWPGYCSLACVFHTATFSLKQKKRENKKIIEMQKNSSAKQRKQNYIALRIIRIFAVEYQRFCGLCLLTSGNLLTCSDVELLCGTFSCRTETMFFISFVKTIVRNGLEFCGWCLWLGLPCERNLISEILSSRWAMSVKSHSNK